MPVSITSEIQKRSEVNFGNPYRLLKLMEKARRGEKITYISLGGSVTHGCFAESPQTCYAALIASWLKKNFPQCEVVFENAGIGATGSLIGVHRLKKDVLCFNPDFVVVEYSVNEDNSETVKEAYDNLIFNILNHGSSPAVLLLSMMIKGGGNAQFVHSKVGFHYNVPMISFRDAFWPEVEKGNLAFEELYGDDVIHPNNTGHRVAAELVTAYLEKLLKLSLNDYSDDKYEKHLVSDQYKNANIYYPDDIKPVSYGCFRIAEMQGLEKMKKGWRADTNGEPMIFSFKKATRIFVLFEKTNRGDGGKAEIEVDGKCVSFDADFTDGWGIYSNCEQIFESKKPSDVTITVKPKLEKNKEFSIVGILVS